jgi:poly(3-hydroxyalkanoate) synthetase
MCKICGDEKASYRARARQTLCDSCASDTPDKVGRTDFDQLYWNGDDTVTEAIKREFYSDYLASTYTTAQYIKATTSEAV